MLAVEHDSFLSQLKPHVTSYSDAVWSSCSLVILVPLQCNPSLFFSCCFYTLALLWLAETGCKGLGRLVWNSKGFWSSGDTVQNEPDGIQDKCRDLPLGRRNQMREFKWGMTLSAAVLRETCWTKWSANGESLIPPSKEKKGKGRKSPEGRIRVMLVYREGGEYF